MSLIAVYVVKVITNQESEITGKINALPCPDIRKAYNPQSIFAKPVFPGYIFVDLDITSEAYYKILNIPGALYFLNPDYGVYPLDKSEVRCLKDETGTLIGMPVVITGGKYKDIEALVRDVAYPLVTVMLPLGVTTKIHIRHIAPSENMAQAKPKISAGLPVKITSGDYGGLAGTVEIIDPPVVWVRVCVYQIDTLVECRLDCLDANTLS